MDERHRVSAIGHGRPELLTPEEAIQVAKNAPPENLNESSREARSIGLMPGNRVSGTPDDYGNPVHGRRLGWKDEEIIIRHEDPSVGRMNPHFQRTGFDVEAQRRAA
jgi:hypothetical protein